MSKKTKLYQCPAYLFCNYELLEKTSSQIAKECRVVQSTIYKWLKKFDIRVRTISESKTGKLHPKWKEDEIGYGVIHLRAHKIQPKPADGKCAICNQVADKKGITKLIHSNKDHTYKMPINPDEWWWIHDSCHKKYDIKTTWTPERRKEYGEKMKKHWEEQKFKDSWIPERRKELSEKNKIWWTLERRKEHGEKMREISKKTWTPERRKKVSDWMKKYHANKSKRSGKPKVKKDKRHKRQLDYWFN